MSTKKAKYYTVWSGKAPGVYATWDECEAQVKGVLGAKYKSFATREEAEKALQEPAEEHIKRRSNGSSESSVHSPLSTVHSPFSTPNPPVYPSMSVDGACSGNPGKMEYRGVDTVAGYEYFHFGPAEGGTNNIAEFLAIVHALALLQKMAAERPLEKDQWLNLPIYSDSRTALAWVRKRKCGTKLEMTPQNERLFHLIQRAENWLAVHSYANRLIKWDTDHWGEIPADFGRK